MQPLGHQIDRVDVAVGQRRRPAVTPQWRRGPGEPAHGRVERVHVGNLTGGCVHEGPTGELCRVEENASGAGYARTGCLSGVIGSGRMEKNKSETTASAANGNSSSSSSSSSSFISSDLLI